MHPALDGVRLIVFDLDGTLVDSAPDIAAAVDAALTGYGAPPAGIDKVRTWIGNGSRRLIERAQSDAGLDRIDSNEMHHAFLHHYAGSPCERTALYPGARECLQTQDERGLLQVLVTNKPVAFLPPILEHLDITRFFAHTFGGDSLTQKKPHPAPLQYAAKRSGVIASDALIVGDSRNDIEAGKAAGFRTLAVTYGYNHGEPIADSNPDFLIDSLAELR